MNCKAVIFDLFGTLVDSFSTEAYDTSLREMAEAVSANYEDYIRVWSKDIANDRNTGVFPTSGAVMEAMCDRLGIRADEEQIRAAAAARERFMRKTLVPRNNAIDVLTAIRENGMKTALISNCSPDTVELWDETPFPPYFDVTVFSSAAGVRKPDLRIYRLALEQLAIEPEYCMYVGDGDGNELTGALEAGMYPVKIAVPYEKNPRLDTGREEWDGPVISSLTGLLNVIF